MIDSGLKDRIVLITGANHGIGAATALRFAAQGANVFVTLFREHARFSEADLTEARSRQIGGSLLYEAMRQQSGNLIATRIRDAGGRSAVWEADLFDAAQIPALFDRCEAELGPVDVLVNNHTHSVHETFDPAMAEHDHVPLVTSAQIDRHFIVNARACALLMAEYVKRYLARQGQAGRIINLSTDAAHAHVGNVNYSASKHAIESYSRSAAAELGKYGITVNIVAPGPTQTGYITPEMETKVAQETPLRRVGMPEDVADVIVFLASEQARWLTGQLLYVGGGWRMPQ